MALTVDHPVDSNAPSGEIGEGRKKPLDEDLLDGIRREVRRRECDMSTVVNECLRASLHRRKNAARPASALPEFSLGRPRVNLADRDALETCF